jgi:DNA-binding CsgD family transcriptional regulator
VRLARQAQQIPADIPGRRARECSSTLTNVLTAAGDLTAAEGICEAGLARSREAGDLENLSELLTGMADLDLRAGRIQDAAAHLRESLQITARTGGWLELLSALDRCGHLCAATTRWAEAVTVWAAYAALLQHEGSPDVPAESRRRHQPLRAARQALGPARAREAEDRGAAMSLAAAAEYALLLTAPGPQLPTTALPATALPATALPGQAAPAAALPAAASGLGQLSARERELITLVAQGRTNAQIAAQLYISVRTVSSHLDRIRDKTGCRRRADLTRLALTAGLV